MLFIDKGILHYWCYKLTYLTFICNTLCFFYAENLEMNAAEPNRPLSMPAGTGGMMASNMGMKVSNSGMLASNSGMGLGMLASSSTSAMALGIDASAHTLISSVRNSGMASDSGLLLGQQSMLMPGMSASVGMGPSGGMVPSTGTISKPALFPSTSGIGTNPGTPHSAGVSPMTGMAQRMGAMTANAAISSSTRSVSSHVGSVTAAKPQQGTGVTSPSAWTGSNTPFAYPPGADFCQQYNVAPNLCYYTASGNCPGKGIWFWDRWLPLGMGKTGCSRILSVSWHPPSVLAWCIWILKGVLVPVWFFLPFFTMYLFSVMLFRQFIPLLGRTGGLRKLPEFVLSAVVKWFERALGFLAHVLILWLTTTWGVFW